jgi:hypothetical protein
MQANASELEADRTKRLAQLEKKEKADAEAEERARLRNHRLSGRAGFLNQANRKVSEMDLGERINRGRQGLVRDRDED